MEELNKQQEDFVLELARAGKRDIDFIEALEDWTGRDLKELEGGKEQ